jgi:predicted RND superfamily exporter protein
MSIINADDIIIDEKSDTIIIGNLTVKAKKAANLPQINGPESERLPEKDKVLRTLIPYLKKEITGNKLLQGTLISEDGLACAILVPIEKKSENKIRILRKELYAMTDPEKLKKRFSGTDYFFPHNIYNKEIDGVLVNDNYIEQVTSENKLKVRKFFSNLFSDLDDDFNEFYSFVINSEVNSAYIDRILQMIESDEIYESEKSNLHYEDTIDEMYNFMVSAIDRFSNDNLELRLYDINNIHDTGALYDRLLEITAEGRPANIKTYIAGSPIAETLIERFVINDMSLFLNLTILVIIAILYFSFRSSRGVLLPLGAVGITVVWVMGMMMLSGQKLTSGTIPMPTILIAVGSAYIIHYISRYLEETIENGTVDIKQAVLQTADKVQLAINLAAITTISAFMSVIASAGVTDVKILGMLTSIGIIITVLLTYSFLPAVLVLLPLPKNGFRMQKPDLISKLVIHVGKFAYNNSKIVFAGAFLTAIVALIGIFMLKTESSIVYFFREDNPISTSSKFINKKLTGIGQMAIIFKMRDKVKISSPDSQKELKIRIDEFLKAYSKLEGKYPKLSESAQINHYFFSYFSNIKSVEKESQADLEMRIKVLADILNEYFEIEVQQSSQAESDSQNKETFDITSLSDN